MCYRWVRLLESVDKLGQMITKLYLEVNARQCQHVAWRDSNIVRKAGKLGQMYGMGVEEKNILKCRSGTSVVFE